MDRREFLIVAGSACAAPALGSAQPDRPVRIIPPEKGIDAAMLRAWKERGTREVYRGRRRHAIGMPVGGIAAGQLYILGDGTLGGWRVDGRLNPTGWGATSYQTRRAERELEQGFAIRVEAAGEGRDGAAAWDLVLADAEHGGSFDAVEFIGEYPIAEVRYARTSDPPPVEVVLRAFSPFCPLNARDSALPCTVLRWSIRNTGGSQAKVWLNGWLENGVERDEDLDTGPVWHHTTALREPALHAILHSAVGWTGEQPATEDRLLFDFEGGFEGWNLDGEAFAEGPAAGARIHQNAVTGFIGAKFAGSFVSAENTQAGDRPTGRATSPEFTIDRRFLTFRIGGGSHAGRTCVNLLIDGKVVVSSRGRDNEALDPRIWDLAEHHGKAARLQLVDAVSGAWGHINADHFILTDRIPAELARPRAGSLTSGTMALALIDAPGAWSSSERSLVDGTPHHFGAHPGPSRRTRGEPATGILGTHFELAPGEVKEVVFVVAWCFPNLHTGHGQMYANWFEDAESVVRSVAGELPRLEAQTRAFHRAYYEDSTLPWWLLDRLAMPVSTLATGTCQWWKNGRFWGWEGVGCCHGTCTHVWNYSHAEARLFPELARSTRAMQDLGTGFEAATGRVAFRGEVDGGFAYAADGQSGTILKCYREHLCSADDAFLRQHWPRIRLALEYLVAKDGEAAAPDGLIEGSQHNTFDIDFHGANTFVGSLYLAALLAGAKMAERVGDADAAARFRALATRGRALTEDSLFRHGYFVQRIPAGASDRWQYGDGCLTDQVFGQNWARCLALGDIYDPAKVRSALAAVYRHNWAPPGGSLRQHNERFPAEREFARDREGGLFICTWPHGGRPGEPVRYRDEVWTGCEYQAAGGMVWEGLVDEGLAIVRAVHDRYDGALHNPWNEVECGDHYARAMASWGVLQAIAGFRYDGPAGELAMDPRLQPDAFSCFYSGAAGWGVIRQYRDAALQTNGVEVRWGQERLVEFGAGLPRRPASAAVTAGGPGGAREIAAGAPEERDGLWWVRFGAPVELAAGETVRVDWTW